MEAMIKIHSFPGTHTLAIASAGSRAIGDFYGVIGYGLKKGEPMVSTDRNLGEGPRTSEQ